ncbi:MAG TPA: carbohydrate kinase [Candidatus Limnocylindrales bacterium]
MTLITCIGELLVDFLPTEEGGRTTGFRMHPGGSLLNVAVATARLGQPVALAGKVGTDFFGRYLRGHAEREGVDLRWLLDSPAPTTLAFVALEHGEPAFVFYGDGAADSLFAPGDVPDGLLDETAILHVGSISLLRGTTPEAVLATFERLQGRALLSLDPNLRPGLVQDEVAYRALLDRLISLADVVKLSTADLGWLLAGRSASEATATLLAHGPALVVVTRGAAGVHAVRAGGTAFDVPAEAVPVVDAVGAGDAFNAGLLTRLAELGATNRSAVLALSDDVLRDVLRFAGVVAALNCTRPGADSPSRAEVESLLLAQTPS